MIISTAATRWLSAAAPSRCVCTSAVPKCPLPRLEAIGDGFGFEPRAVAFRRLIRRPCGHAGAGNRATRPGEATGNRFHAWRCAMQRADPQLFRDETGSFSPESKWGACLRRRALPRLQPDVVQRTASSGNQQTGLTRSKR